MNQPLGSFVCNLSSVLGAAVGLPPAASTGSGDGLVTSGGDQFVTDTGDRIVLG